MSEILNNRFKLDLSIDDLEINLQGISLWKCTDGHGAFLFSETSEYEIQVRRLINDLDLPWRSLKEVQNELGDLAEDSNFRIATDFESLSDSEKSSFIQELISFGYLHNWHVSAESGNSGYVIRFDQCFNFFKNVRVTKQASNYAFFLALRIGHNQSDYVSELLDYQLEFGFQNNLLEFSNVLIQMTADRRDTLGRSTRDFVKDWIDLKFKSEQSIKKEVDGYKTYNLPVLFGDEWFGFKKDFADFMSKYRVNKRTKPFQNIIYYLWANKKWFQDSVPDAKYLVEAFHAEFSPLFNVKPAALLKGLASDTRQDEYEGMPSDIRNSISKSFDKYTGANSN